MVMVRVRVGLGLVFGPDTGGIWVSNTGGFPLERNRGWGSHGRGWVRFGRGGARRQISRGTAPLARWASSRAVGARNGASGWYLGELHLVHALAGVPVEEGLGGSHTSVFEVEEG